MGARTDEPGDPVCGNGALDPGEECDDGNRVGCDGCSSDCLPEGCGNGRLDCGEICDGDNLMDTCDSALGLPQGTVRCTESCRLDLSGCHDCGNGLVEPGTGEECDGAALSGHTCESLGFAGGLLACDSECRFDDSGCSSCGNQLAEGGEACDGADLAGQTCQSAGFEGGTLACTSFCELETAGCTACGDGAVEGDEECDDGNVDPGDGCAPGCAVEPGWSCTGSPSVCIPVGCGDGLIGPNEACDGPNLAGETCLSQGYLRAGGAGLACSADCQSFDLSGCVGGAIDSVVQLEAAVGEAHATGGRERIGVHGNTTPGSYEATSSIVLDECGGPCTGSLPEGVVIAPLGAPVCFTASGSFPVFEVITGLNEFRGLCFDNVEQAYLLDAGQDAGGNVITHNWFDNTTTTPLYSVEIESSENEILSNRFLSQAPLPGITAILVNEQGNTLAMNVISGGYDWALLVTTFPNALPWEVTYIDHNSIQATGAGQGVFLNAVSRICYRNNIVYGSGASTGLYLASVDFASMASCEGYQAQGNVNLNHAVPCSGPDCAALCTGIAAGSDLCDLALDPGWQSPELCLHPASNPPNGLVDGAVIFSGPSPYDHHDDDPSATYTGNGPDVGAREASTTRHYGGFPSTCP